MMYKRILVPLDGSQLSECSLEHAKTIAIGCQVSEVVLLRVVTPLSPYVVGTLAVSGEAILRAAELRNQTEVKDYLKKVGDDLRKADIVVQVVSLDGSPAEEILDYAQNNEVDMIIMTTHGRSGPSRWLIGSVADKVIRNATVPVLMMSPPGCR
jgi:nucleotide-binding universal stress UspA family protein